MSLALTYREVGPVTCEQIFRCHLVLAVGDIHIRHTISLYTYVHGQVYIFHTTGTHYALAVSSIVVEEEEEGKTQTEYITQEQHKHVNEAQTH